MIKTLLLLLAICLGLFFGPSAINNKGYVLIATEQWSVETSITGAVVIAALVYVLLLVGEWLLLKFMLLFRDTKHYRAGRHLRKSQQQSFDGMRALAEADYAKAERLLSAAAEHSDRPLLNYLNAAEAAQQLGERARRDEYLVKARALNQDPLAVALTQARLLLADAQPQEALQALQPIHDKYPRHPEVLRLLALAYQQTGQWAQYRQLLPTMQKAALIDKQAMPSHTCSALVSELSELARTDGSDGVLNCWQAQPRKVKQDSSARAAVIQALQACQADHSAYLLAMDFLNQGYDAAVIEAAVQLDLEDYHPLNQLLSRLAARQGQDRTLHKALAQLAIKQQHWEQAQQSLLQVVEQQPDANSLFALAQVYEHQKQWDNARHCYRQASELLLSAP